MAYKIREIRESKNLSQTELAEKSQVSRAIISGLESGRITETSTKTLVKIADTLGCKVSDIFLL